MSHTHSVTGSTPVRRAADPWARNQDHEAAIAQEITDRLVASRALAASERGLADAQRTAHIGSFEYDVGDARRLTVEVNLSVRQLLAPDVVDTVAEVLRHTGLHPGDLCLELTEGLFMRDVEYFRRTLASLKDLGVHLVIDDFGTGYSSLSYLKRFPVDAVKVDRDFVDGLGTDPHDSALVAAIVAMADALGLEVTAEGVETEAQLVILERLQCRRAQGFHLARPMPPADPTALLAASHRWIDAGGLEPSIAPGNVFVRGGAVW